MSTLPPHQRHSPTSKQAAVEAIDGAESWRARVRSMIYGTGQRGATDDEVQMALQLNPSTQRPRRVELVRAGLVVDSGKVRKTRSGRNATVWIAREHVEPQTAFRL